MRKIAAHSIQHPVTFTWREVFEQGQERNKMGEGFDFPFLKIAAIHAPHQSLAVTLQFIGRFARTRYSKKFGASRALPALTSKGRTMKGAKPDPRRRRVKIRSGKIKPVAEEQASPHIKQNVDAALAEALEMGDEFLPAPAFLRNELILRGVTFLKSLVRRSTESQLRALQKRTSKAEFFVALAILARNRT